MDPRHMSTNATARRMDIAKVSVLFESNEHATRASDALLERGVLGDADELTGEAQGAVEGVKQAAKEAVKAVKKAVK